MGLLFRLFRLIFTVIGALVFRLFLNLLEILLPLLLRLLSFIFALMTFSLLSAFVGPRTSVSRTAELWTERIMRIGIPLEYKDAINRIMEGFTWLALVSGWAFTTLFFVAVLRVVFGFFT